MITIYEVLTAINEARRLLGSYQPLAKPLNMQVLFDVDNRLIDLESRIMNELGDGPQNEAFPKGGK